MYMMNLDTRDSEVCEIHLIYFCEYACACFVYIYVLSSRNHNFSQLSEFGLVEVC